MSEIIKDSNNFGLIAPFNDNSLPDFVLRKSEIELNETPETKLSGLQELKRKIQDYKDVNYIDFHDDFLTQYLRRSKYQVSKSIKQIRNYVEARNKEARYFENISDRYFTEDGLKTYLNILPFRCPDGCPVVHFRFGAWNPNKMPLEDLQNLAVVVMLQILRDPMTQINGFKLIFDFKGASTDHLKVFSIGNCYLGYHLAMNCFPGRYKALHFVNESPIMTAVWFTVKRFIPDKIKKRTYFHSKPEDLLNYFPSSMLPTEYGGEVIESTIRDWIRIANKEQKYLTEKGLPNFY